MNDAEYEICRLRSFARRSEKKLSWINGGEDTMTTIRFAYYAMKLDNGLHQVNLYVKQLEPTWDDTPRAERKAIEDGAQIVRDLVAENEAMHPSDRLLVGGEPPPEAFPIFMFAIGVNWNRQYKNAHYSRVCYQRYEMDAKWNPVAALGMEQYEYTMSVLRKREKLEIQKRLSE